MVIEQAVVTSATFSETLHSPVEYVRDRRVVRIDRFPALEIHVGILRGSAHLRVIGAESASAVFEHVTVVDQRPQVGVFQRQHAVEFVRGTEAVEKMHERHAALQGGHLCQQGYVLCLLHRSGGEQGEPGLAYAHHVGMITEYRQPLGGQRTGRDVDHRRGQLAGNLVHVGDHQQQALRGRESRGQGSGLQGAVDRPGGAAFALHLGDARHLAPEVGAAFGRPLVGEFAHRRGRRDRVDRADLVEPVGHRNAGLVAVDDLRGFGTVASCSIRHS